MLNERIVILLGSVVNIDQLAFDLAVATETVPSGHRVSVDPCVRIGLVCNFLQLRSPDRFTIVSKDLEFSIERGVHDRVIGIDPRIGLRDVGDGECGIARFIRTGRKCRGNEGFRDTELALKEREKVLRSAKVTVRASKVRFARVLARSLESTCFVRN